MKSFIDWLEGYLEDKLDESQLKRIREVYDEIEYKKFTNNVKIPWNDNTFRDLTEGVDPLRDKIGTTGCACDPNNKSGICNCIMGSKDVTVFSQWIDPTYNSYGNITFTTTNKKDSDLK